MTSLTFDELNNLIDPYNDDMLIRTLFKLSVEGKDICSQCKERCNIVSCNKCGEAVCNKNTCSTLFPHYNNTIYAVCYSCSKEIGDKMNLVIDLNKLSLLKSNITSGNTSSDQKQSSMSENENYKE